MLKDTPRSRMWESCLSGSERGWGTTMIKAIKYRPETWESPSYSKITILSTSNRESERLINWFGM